MSAKKVVYLVITENYELTRAMVNWMRANQWKSWTFITKYYREEKDKQPYMVTQEKMQ